MVNFKYNKDADKYVLSDVNLDIKSGETVGIIGPTGSSKTTLVNLIMRLYDVDGGSITIDDVSDYESSLLMKKIGLKAGQNVDKAIMDEAMSKIQATGAFEPVTYALHGTAEPYDLVFNCNRGPTHEGSIGVRIDTEALKAYGRELEHELLDLTRRILDYAGPDFNPDSPRQLGEFLFGKLGLPSGKKTASGQYATDEKTLQKIVNDHPVVKAILEYKDEKKLYEILPNYLFRTGADVIWRTSNWGQPPLHIDKYEEVPDISEKYGIPDEGHDGLLLAGLPELISGSDKDKVLIVLHTSTSHGPSYYKKYPAEFEVFTPVCRTVEMSTSPVGELVNAYDNTVLYTDYLIHSIIEDLKSLPEWRTSMIFVSDHGESLGENNLYMHGVPISIAPAEQIEIPFIVWTSDGTPLKENDVLTQHHVFHSVLNFLSVDSPAYDESMNIFADE